MNFRIAILAASTLVAVSGAAHGAIIGPTPVVASCVPAVAAGTVVDARTGADEHAPNAATGPVALVGLGGVLVFGRRR